MSEERVYPAPSVYVDGKEYFDACAEGIRTCRHRTLALEADSIPPVAGVHERLRHRWPLHTRQ